MACIQKRDKWMHACTDDPKAICTLNFTEAGGIKKSKILNAYLIFSFLLEDSEAKYNFFFVINVPSRKETAFPMVFERVDIAVAVVLCSGGNHSADIAGGAPIAIGPPRPFKNWPMWISLQTD